MARDRKMIGTCPKCNADNLACSYNHFEQDGLVIDTWEHKCLDCAVRETTAFRSDDEETLADGVDPSVCPYCGRAGEPAGA